MEYLELSSAPYEEECVQVSSKIDYLQAQRAECYIFKRMLERQFPPPQGAYFSVKPNQHDFGTYYEVVVKYENEEGENFAYDMEENIPAKWDDEALAEIAANEEIQAYHAAAKRRA